MEQSVNSSQRKQILSWCKQTFTQCNLIGEDNFVSIIEKNGVKSYLYHPSMETVQSLIKTKDDSKTGILCVSDLYDIGTFDKDCIFLPQIRENKDKRDTWYKYQITEANVTNRQDGITPLTLACYYGRPQLVLLLLSVLDHPVNIQTVDGCTPLMETIAAYENDVEERLQCLQHLVKYGASIQNQQQGGHNALTLSCYNGKEVIVKFLDSSFSMSLDWNHQTTLGHTPLMFAIYSGNFDVLRYLINSKEVDLLKENFNSLTAFDISLLLDSESRIKGLLAVYMQYGNKLKGFIQKRIETLYEAMYNPQSSLMTSQQETLFVCCLMSVAYLGRFKQVRNVILDSGVLDFITTYVVWKEISQQIKTEFCLILAAYLFYDNDNKGMTKLIATNWAAMQFHYENEHIDEADEFSLDRFMGILSFFICAEGGKKWILDKFKEYPKLGIKIADFDPAHDTFVNGFFKEVAKILEEFNIEDGFGYYSKHDQSKTKKLFSNEKSLRQRIENLVPIRNNIIAHLKKTKNELQILVLKKKHAKPNKTEPNHKEITFISKTWIASGESIKIKKTFQVKSKIDAKGDREENSKKTHQNKQQIYTFAEVSPINIDSNEYLTKKQLRKVKKQNKKRHLQNLQMKDIDEKQDDTITNAMTDITKEPQNQNDKTSRESKVVCDNANKDINMTNEVIQSKVLPVGLPPTIKQKLPKRKHTMHNIFNQNLKINCTNDKKKKDKLKKKDDRKKSTNFNAKLQETIGTENTDIYDIANETKHDNLQAAETNVIHNTQLQKDHVYHSDKSHMNNIDKTANVDFVGNIHNFGIDTFGGLTSCNERQVEYHFPRLTDIENERQYPGTADIANNWSQVVNKGHLYKNVNEINLVSNAWTANKNGVQPDQNEKNHFQPKGSDEFENYQPYKSDKQKEEKIIHHNDMNNYIVNMSSIWEYQQNRQQDVTCSDKIINKSLNVPFDFDGKQNQFDKDCLKGLVSADYNPSLEQNNSIIDNVNVKNNGVKCINNQQSNKHRANGLHVMNGDVLPQAYNTKPQIYYNNDITNPDIPHHLNQPGYMACYFDPAIVGMARPLNCFDKNKSQQCSEISNHNSKVESQLHFPSATHEPIPSMLRDIIRNNNAHDGKASEQHSNSGPSKGHLLVQCTKDPQASQKSEASKIKSKTKFTATTESESGYMSPPIEQEDKTMLEQVEQPMFVKNWQSRSKKWNAMLLKLVQSPLKSITKVGSINFLNSEQCLISTGSCGTVVRVGIRDDGSEVALKCMVKAYTSLICNELQSLRELQHPNIIHYKDYVEDANFAYVALELCEYTLDEYVKFLNTNGTLGKHKRRLCMQIMVGLKALHDAKVLHMDLKPRNVLVDVKGNIRLADFGLSHRLNEEQNTFYHTSVHGTKCWRAPETISIPLGPGGNRGRYKPSTDIYVSSMILYFVVTGGKHPFGEDTARCEMNILNGCPPNIRILRDEVFVDLFLLMMDPDMNRRISTDQCLRHPFFWNDHRRFEFLVSVGHDHEVAARISNDLIKAIESSLMMKSQTGKWMTNIDHKFLKYMGWENLRLNSVLDILTVVIPEIDERWQHIQQNVKGPVGEHPDSYILACFSGLFMSVYEAVCRVGWQRRYGLREFFSSIITQQYN